ncbi:unnamed protein product, partial [Ixodes hexagonus]
GFKRELVYRGGNPGKVAADVYYYDSAGHKMRSMPDVLSYLGKHPRLGLAAENFSFRRVTIHKPPHEVVRQAKAAGRAVPRPPPSVPKSEGKRSAKKRCFCCDTEDACRKRLKLRKRNVMPSSRLRTVAGKKTPDSQGPMQPEGTALNGTKDDHRLDSVITTVQPTVSPVKTPVPKTPQKPLPSPATPVNKRPEQSRARVVLLQNKSKSPVRVSKSNEDVDKRHVAPSWTGGSTMRTYSKVMNACDRGPVLLEGPVMKQLDEPTSESPKKALIVKVAPAQNLDAELLHLQRKGPKHRWKVANKNLPRTGASLELCNLHCALAKGQFPSLQCPKCLCLFHPVCVKEESGGTAFICKACQKKVSSSTKSISTPTIITKAATNSEERIPVSTTQPASTVSTSAPVFGTVLTTRGSPRSFPAIMSGMVLSVPSMASSPSSSGFSIPSSPLVQAPYAQVIGPFPASAPVRFTVISPGSSMPIHFPMPSSPTIFLSTSTTMPSAVISSAPTPYVVSSATASRSTGSSTPPSFTVVSSAVAASFQTASSMSAGLKTMPPLRPAPVGLTSVLLRPSCPNITIVPGRFPNTTCVRQTPPLAPMADAARTALLSMVQQLNQRPTMPPLQQQQQQQTTTSTEVPAPVSSCVSPVSNPVAADKEPVHLDVVKNEDTPAESRTICSYVVVGSGGVTSTSLASLPAPWVNASLLRGEEKQCGTASPSTVQTERAHSNGSLSPEQSASFDTVDDSPQADIKDPSILAVATTKSSGHSSVTEPGSEHSSAVSASATTSDVYLGRDSRAYTSDRSFDRLAMTGNDPVLDEDGQCKGPDSSAPTLRECAASKVPQGLTKLCRSRNGAAARTSAKGPSEPSNYKPVCGVASKDASAQERRDTRLGGGATTSGDERVTGELPIWVVSPTSTVCVRSGDCAAPEVSVTRLDGSHGGLGSVALTDVANNLAVLHRIFSFLPVAALCRVATVCWGWNLLSKHPNFWGEVDLRGVRVTDWDACTLMLQQRRTHSLVVEGSLWSQLEPWVKRLECVRSLSLHDGSPADLATFVKLFPQMISLSAVHLTRPQHCHGSKASQESVLLGELQALLGMPHLQSLRLSSARGLLLCPWVAPKEAEEQRFLTIRSLSVTTLRCSSLEAFVSLQCLPHLEDLELGDCASWTNQSYLGLGQLSKLKCLSLIRGQDQPCFRYVLLKFNRLEVLRLKRWTFRESVGPSLAQLPRLRQLLFWPQAQDLASNNVYALRSCLGLSTLQRLSWVVDCGGSVSCSLATSLEIPVAAGRPCDCEVSQSPSESCGCRLLEESLDSEDGTSTRWLTAGQLASILKRNLGSDTTVCVSLRVGF